MLKKIDFVNSIKELTELELTAKIKDDEIRMKKLLFTHAVSPLENPQSIRILRREIARMKTQIRKIQIGA